MDYHLYGFVFLALGWYLRQVVGLFGKDIVLDRLSFEAVATSLDY